MNLRTFLTGAMAAAMTLACGDDSDDAPSRTTVQKQCDALMLHWCDHLFDCVVDGGRVTSEEGAEATSQCTSVLQNGICDQAVSIEPEYDACMDAITAMSCDVILAGYDSGSLDLPPICMGIVLIDA